VAVVDDVGGNSRRTSRSPAPGRLTTGSAARRLVPSSLHGADRQRPGPDSTGCAPFNDALPSTCSTLSAGRSPATPERRSRGVPSYPLLQGKRAVVFGAGGSIGSAVAKAFASEGAEVFLAGRSEESLQVVGSRVAVRTECPSGSCPVRQTGRGRHQAGRMRGIANDRFRPRHPARNRAARDRAVAWPRYFRWGAHLAADLSGVLHGDPRCAGRCHRAAVHSP